MDFTDKNRLCQEKYKSLVNQKYQEPIDGYFEDAIYMTIPVTTKTPILRNILHVFNNAILHAFAKFAFNSTRIKFAP